MRRKPTAFFLGDCAFLSDAKFRRLARQLPDHDDFNSAVGAYFIALAAARRNGIPVIDVADETGSRFVPELVAAGLLTPDGFPERAFGEWAPSRPKYASDAAPSAPNRSESSEHSEGARLQTLPSLPFPSTPTTEGGLGETDDRRADLDAWLLVRHRIPTERQRAFLDAYQQTFDVTGPERAAKLILANPADPIAALKADLDAFRRERLAAVEAAAPKPAPVRRPTKREDWREDLRALIQAGYEADGAA